MRFPAIVATAMAAFTLGGCADNPASPRQESTDLAVQEQASALAASRAERINASGAFDAIVDFTTLTLTPQGRNCVLTVDGQLVFTGTLEGPAIGQTTALVFASCAEVATNPPGTFADVFRSELQFDGLINGQDAEARVRYVGRSARGGKIRAHLLLSDGVLGLLDVDARLAVGGTYQGPIITR